MGQAFTRQINKIIFLNAQLQLAEETDYSKDFEEDLRGNVEHGDIYDEHLAQLPEFEVHKLGKNLGWTQLPIVTRRKALWSTPLPRTRPFSHSWAWLYTKPLTAATQRQKQITTISPEVNKIEKSVINDKNVEKQEERKEKISEEQIKTTTPRKMQNETNLNAKKNNKVVVEVRSNVIAIEPAVDSKNTDPSKTGSGFAWPRSWDNNEADDRLAIRSPTFNCRVLDAAVDGIPSANNDQTCPLDFPGIASDKSCKCTYEVSGRDEEGCATGFIYTCLRTVKSSNNDLKS
uniref:Uncharacterized protein n=1 Tax=Meloidogyne floridensis TaxID=298350 RepID=A0A915NCV2_9BILA